MKSQREISVLHDIGAATSSTYGVDKKIMLDILRQVPGYDKLSPQEQTRLLYDLTDAVNWSDAQIEDMYKAMMGIPEAAWPYVNVDPSVIAELRNDLGKPYDYSEDLKNLPELMEEWPDDVKKIYRKQVDLYKNKQ